MPYKCGQSTSTALLEKNLFNIFIIWTKSIYYGKYFLQFIKSLNAAEPTTPFYSKGLAKCLAEINLFFWRKTNMGILSQKPKIPNLVGTQETRPCQGFLPRCACSLSVRPCWQPTLPKLAMPFTAT